MMWPPAASSHVTNAIHWPSGDHAGWYSPTSAAVSRRAVLSAMAFTHSRSNAVNASCRPSGDATGLRICRAVTMAVVSTR
jgi:hypothetical protein